MEQGESGPTLDSRKAAREARHAARRRKNQIIGASAAGALVLGAAIIAVALVARPGGAQRAGGTASVAASATQPASAGPTTAAPPAAEPTATTPAAGASAPESVAVTPPPAPKLGRFSVADAKRYLTALTVDIGVRAGGTSNERKAAGYIRSQLEAMGYAASTESFPLTNGTRSQNVVAVLKGTTDRRLIVGAHYDSKSPAPGANDNGTGSVALMAIAKELADEKLPYTVEFVWFGTEEMVDSNGDHHHFGSRYHAKSLSAAEREHVDGMLSVDMIGYGPQFRVRTMNRGPQGLRRKLISFAKGEGLPVGYMRDPSKFGYSDHEPFELLGLPTAWIEWRDDPTYHSKDDVESHVKWDKVRDAGQLVLDFMRSIGPTDLSAFHSS